MINNKFISFSAVQIYDLSSLFSRSQRAIRFSRAIPCVLSEKHRTVKMALLTPVAYFALYKFHVIIGFVQLGPNFYTINW